MICRNRLHRAWHVAVTQYVETVALLSLAVVVVVMVIVSMGIIIIRRD